MKILETAGCIGCLLGMAGIAGAIETETSLISAIIVLASGILLMIVHSRLNRERYRRDKNIDRYIGKRKGRKEKWDTWRLKKPG